MGNDGDRLTSGLSTAQGKPSESERMLVGTTSTGNQREQRQQTQAGSAKNYG